MTEKELIELEAFAGYTDGERTWSVAPLTFGRARINDGDWHVVNNMY